MTDDEKKALNREIAELIGWRFLSQPTPPDREKRVIVYSPAGVRMQYNNGIVWSATFPESNLYIIPNYADDLNATAAACAERGWAVQTEGVLHQRLMGFPRDLPSAWLAIPDENIGFEQYEATSHTEQEAAAIALRDALKAKASP